MKVIYVTMQFPVPSETFLSNDVEALRQQGVCVEVFGLRPKHASHREILYERNHAGLYVENFGIKSFFRAICYILFNPFVFLYLIFNIIGRNSFSFSHVIKSMILLPSVISIFSSISKKQPDVVHLFWGHYPAMVGLLVNKYMPKTVLTQFLGAHDLLAQYPLGHYLAGKVSALFTHSEQNISALIEIGVPPDKIHVIKRGIVISTDVHSALENKFFSIRPFHFVTAARLIKEKGVDDVIAVFSSLKNRLPSARLTIAGDGPDRERLQKMVKDAGLENDVFFMGHIPQKELIDIMRRSHFFLFMSRYLAERLPNVVKEAMLQGCIVVATHTVGIKELISDKETGFIVPQKGIDRAAKIIEELLKNEDFMASFSQRASQAVRDNFDVVISMRNYINIWRALHV